ncbi:uncharacterized protein BX664DRAFT_249231, partial [Halteromyces radiatus]|uniref:uncharacterized protein n=1 Tax=Halteromyces radiatus TaxID=101107 RepID=UPI00221EC1DA
IHWIRTFVLILSILIIITSLGRYSKETIPLFSLLHDHSTQTEEFRQAIIQDRRLIATLVAAQASIICPLFLLIGNQSFFLLTSQDHHSELTQFWRTALDLLCQFLMPLGLALSWLFCISFDQKTNMIQSHTIWSYLDTSLFLTGNLKYMMVIALVLEMAFVSI